MQLIMLVHSKMFVARSIHQVVNNWSLVFFSKSKNVLNYFAPYFSLRSKYMLYNST
jgi:hypothetical protein